jgi:hypothetical protein
MSTSSPEATATHDLANIETQASWSVDVHYFCVNPDHLFSLRESSVENHEYHPKRWDMVGAGGGDLFSALTIHERFTCSEAGLAWRQPKFDQKFIPYD